MTELPRAADHTGQAAAGPVDADKPGPAGRSPDDPAGRPRPTPSPEPAPKPVTGPRPGPRPSPTSRARRNAAPVPEGLRRPRPTPVDAASVDLTPAAATTAPARTAPATTAPVTPAPAQPASHAAAEDQAQPAVSLREQSTAHPAEPAQARPGTDPRTPGRRAPLWLAAALAVLFLALAGLDGWLLIHQPPAGSKSEREQALSTAKTAVPLILSYDYRHFGSDVSAARSRLTGRAVDDYAGAMAKTVQPTASKAHVVVQAQTDGAGVEAVSGNGRQVTVVVFGEQKVSNTTLTAPRIDLFRVRVTLDLVGGQWLVSKFVQI